MKTPCVKIGGDSVQEPADRKVASVAPQPASFSGFRKAGICSGLEMAFRDSGDYVNYAAMSLCGTGRRILGPAYIVSEDMSVGEDGLRAFADSVNGAWVKCGESVVSPGMKLVYVEETRPGCGFAYFSHHLPDPDRVVGWGKRFSAMYAMPPDGVEGVAVAPYAGAALASDECVSAADGPTVEEMFYWQIPWLRGVRGGSPVVRGGCSPELFRRVVKEAGGIVWECRSIERKAKETK